MDESIRTAAISPLRQRLIDDMNTRRFSPETQRNYIQDVGRFATFLGRSSDTATADDVRRFPRTASTGQHVARRAKRCLSFTKGRRTLRSSGECPVGFDDLCGQLEAGPLTGSKSAWGVAMGWNRWYAARSYVRTALWIVPLLTLVVEQVVIRIAASVDAQVAWVPWVGASAQGILGELDTISTLAISFIVFTFGSLLVAIQVAGGQLTPRIIATTLLRNNVIRFTVGLFSFTLFFAVGIKARSDDRILHVGGTLAVFLGIASTMAFLFLIDYTARLLRPVAIVWRIGEQGIKVIDSVYPETVELPLISAPTRPALGPPARVVVHRGKSGVVLAVNLATLVALARDAEGIIECVHRVGNFVAAEEPLFHLYGGAAALGDDRLRAQVAFGAERTIEQDSTFAFRVIVDVAIKALSKAINDPTTAVLSLDQLHRLLRIVGRRHLHDDSLHDGKGQLRLIFPTPGWDDFVQLACREIRLYGAENFQVARRMRAMIENLMVILPARRHPALQLELDLLQRALAKLHDFPEDLALACKADLQGLGGASSLSAQELWARGDRHS